MNENHHRIITLIAGGVIGVMVFVAIYGVSYVNPMNDSWLINIGSDLSAEYIGWQFYRISSWRFPLSLIENVIYPDAVSLMYVGVPPVLAAVFKLFSPILPETFQPFGITCLFAYILQSALAALLIYNKSKKIISSIIGSLFFILSTTMIGRVYAQNTLAFHAVILFALMVFEEREQLYKGKVRKHVLLWCFAMFIAVNLHMYYVPMIFCFMFFFYLLYAIAEHKVRKFAWIGIPMVSTVLTMWVFGIFYGSHSYGAVGFGDMNFRLNGFFITGNTSFIQHMLGVKSSFRSDYEGFSYIGAGVILLLLIVIMHLIKKRNFSIIKKRTVCALFGVSTVFVLVAMNPNVKINEDVIAGINWSESIYNIFSIFRANGRFIWPVIYILNYCLVIYVSEYMSYKRAIIVLTVCLGVQIFDMCEYILNKRAYVDYLAEAPDTLQDEYWDILAGQNYNEVYFFVEDGESIQQSYSIKTIIALCEYAYKNNMKLNDFYCARKNAERIDQDREVELTEIKNGNADSAKLYVFPDLEESVADLENFELMQVDNIYVGIKNR